MNDFWNERFGTKEYAYGEQPNLFLKQELGNLTPGKILFPAEGEGRNAVYAASLGWNVMAFDPSIEGKKKAELLAQKKRVQIEYIINNYENISFQKEQFDCIVLVFAHMHQLKRDEYHNKLMTFLKPGGTLILEGFSKKQIDKTTGGPRNIEMLFSEQELQKDFNSFSELSIVETNRKLEEGSFHKGDASVIQVLGIK